jgi:hypothetical protein
MPSFSSLTHPRWTLQVAPASWPPCHAVQLRPQLRRDSILPQTSPCGCLPAPLPGGAGLLLRGRLPVRRTSFCRGETSDPAPGPLSYPGSSQAMLWATYDIFSFRPLKVEKSVPWQSQPCPFIGVETDFSQLASTGNILLSIKASMQSKASALATSALSSRSLRARGRSLPLRQAPLGFLPRSHRPQRLARPQDSTPRVIRPLRLLGTRRCPLRGLGVHHPDP